MKVLVTGGAGFIGSNFVIRARAVRPEWKLTVLDSMTYAANLSSLDPVVGDVDIVKGSVTDPELVDEVLKTLKDLSKEGMTMIIVTHEMQFARDVADRLLFFYEGAIVEDGPPADVFDNPKTDRFRSFVRRFQSSSAAR